MALWFGVQGQVTPDKNIPPLRSYPQTTPTQNEKNFLIWTTWLAESVEDLNSSLAQSVGEVWGCKALRKKWRKR